MTERSIESYDDQLYKEHVSIQVTKHDKCVCVANQRFSSHYLTGSIQEVYGDIPYDTKMGTIEMVHSAIETDTNSKMAYFIASAAGSHSDFSLCRFTK